MDGILRTETFVATAAEGYVLIDGSRMAATLSPYDALFLAEQLVRAATEATGQRSVAELKCNRATI